MEQWQSADEALDFAIENEEEAVRFYTELANMAKDPHTKNMFEQNANEERGHKSKLEAVRAGHRLLSIDKRVADLKIENYLVDVEPTPNMTFRDALILAMKREKAAFRLYTDLADQAEEPEIRAIFFGIAQEEAKHKLRFEIEYDDVVMQEN